jgi:hypothetical protein
MLHRGRHGKLPLSLPAYKASAHDILTAQCPSLKRSERSYACFGVGAPSNKEKPTTDCMTEPMERLCDTHCYARQYLKVASYRINA